MHSTNWKHRQKQQKQQRDKTRTKREEIKDGMEWWGKLFEHVCQIFWKTFWKKLLFLSMRFWGAVNSNLTPGKYISFQLFNSLQEEMGLGVNEILNEHWKWQNIEITLHCAKFSLFLPVWVTNQDAVSHLILMFLIIEPPEEPPCEEKRWSWKAGDANEFSCTFVLFDIFYDVRLLFQVNPFSVCN